MGRNHESPVGVAALPSADWIELNWRIALGMGDGALLVIDEVQKVSGWSQRVKRLFDDPPNELIAIEVKSGRLKRMDGQERFCQLYKEARPMVFDLMKGERFLNGEPLEEILTR